MFTCAFISALPAKSGFIPSRVIWLLAFFSVTFCVGGQMSSKAQTEATTQTRKHATASMHTLEREKPISRELKGGEHHEYRLPLMAGQYLKIVTEQRGIDVVVALFGPEGKQLLTVDSPTGAKGAETITAIINADGLYRLEVSSFEKNVSSGWYEVNLTDLRNATESDRALVEDNNQKKELSRLWNERKYQDSVPLAEKLLENRKRVFGIGHPNVADAYVGLARLYSAIGKPEMAEAAYKANLETRKEALGAEHIEVSRALLNLGRFYRGTNKYVLAEYFLSQALVLAEKFADANPEDLAQACFNLGVYYRNSGAYPKAEPLLQRAAATWQKTSSGFFYTATIHLAEMYKGWGDYQSAEAQYLKGLKGLEEEKDISGMGVFQLDLGSLYIATRQYEKAELASTNALNYFIQAGGPTFYNVALAQLNLGVLYRLRENYPKSEEFFLKAEDTFKKSGSRPRIMWHIAFGTLYRAQGKDAQAEELYKTALTRLEKQGGPPEVEDIESRLGLAELYRAQGLLPQATEMLSHVTSILGQQDLEKLGGGSERRKTLYLDLYTDIANSVFSLQAQSKSDDPTVLRLGFDTVLRRKGRVLDAMVDTLSVLRQRTSAKDQDLLNQYVAVRSQLSNLTLRGQGTEDADSYLLKLNRLQEQMEKLETGINATNSDFRRHLQTVNLDAIKPLIPDGAALVEFAQYSPVDARTGKTQAPARYVVYALTSQGQLQWSDLGEVGPINAAIEAFRQKLSTPRQSGWRDAARQLDEALMRPVRKLLGNASTLLLCPDGPLNFVAFSALVDENGQYLVNRYSFVYLTSGRDLFRFQIKRENEEDAIVLANPSFGERETALASRPAKRDIKAIAGSPQIVAPPVSQASDLSRAYFSPLPGTASEAAALKSFFPDARVLTRSLATETALKQVRKPRILHVATHGFFLNSGNGVSSKSETLYLRSGLALAGANIRQNGGEDGILTALEAADLDLWGTKLVVLSACDTGVGEVKNGEGVYGLRRAFVLAGSETQVMSLWSVSDRGTKELMVEYYKRLLRGEGRGEALRQVQLQMLKQPLRSHPYYWASFIQSGEWANLEGKR